MNKDCLKMPSECWFTSYNEAAKQLGLSTPIKLGHLEFKNIDEYFWYTDSKVLPVFRQTDMRILPYLRHLSLTQVLPFSYFPYRGKLYHYSDEDLTIYRVANLLDIMTLIPFTGFLDVEFSLALTASINVSPGRDIAVWMLKPAEEEGEEWKTNQKFAAVIPVFEEDYEIDFSKISSDQIKILGKGDYAYHNDEIYKLELDPQQGISFVKQIIDIKELFKI